MKQDFLSFKNLLIGVACLLAVCVATNSMAESLHFDAAFGQCRYQKSPDGMWWQSDQENISRYKDNGCWQLGVSGPLTPRFSWTARYVNLGGIQTYSLAVTCPSDDCSNRDKSKDFQRAECNPKFLDDNCRYQWLGQGRIRGLSFGLGAELLRAGPLGVEAEAGILIYQLQYDAQIYPMGCTDGSCPWRERINQKDGPYVSPMFGGTLRLHLNGSNSSVFVTTQIFTRTSQHTPITAGYSGYVQTWLAGIRTSF